ncbi:MBL fold metallo-hydrolase [Deltaproteobacteria bacterium TL4]
MKITMLGHATLLIEMEGKTILTDPWLTDPLYWGQLEHSGSFQKMEELPPLDLVLVSHGHQDHFDPGTLSKISKDTPIIIYKSYKQAAKKAGFKEIIAVRHGDTYDLEDLRVHALSSKHPGGIATYIIESRKEKLYFGGDAEYTGQLEKALNSFKPEVCLMPISGGSLGFIHFHMGVREAARLVKAAEAKIAIPIHYHFEIKGLLSKPLIPFTQKFLEYPRTKINQFLLKENCVTAFQNSIAELSPNTKVTLLDYNESWQSPHH